MGLYLWMWMERLKDRFQQVKKMEMAIRTAAALVAVVRAEVEPRNYVKNKTSNDGLPIGSNPSSSFLSLTKPSWIIRTESNVRKEIRKKPEPPCVVCHGTGRVDCHLCAGLGRTNFVHLAMLPKGEWPKWCRTCGGSGLSYCSRCLGTGEFRYIMGFHFMNRGRDPHNVTPKSTHDNNSPHYAADQLLNGS